MVHWKDLKTKKCLCCSSCIYHDKHLSCRENSICAEQRGTILFCKLLTEFPVYEKICPSNEQDRFIIDNNLLLHYTTTYKNKHYKLNSRFHKFTTHPCFQLGKELNSQPKHCSHC